jgi:phage major head subunit gpT-like protein
MDINRGNMATLFTAYNQAFRNGFAVGSAEHGAFTTEIPTSTKIIEFPFLQQLSGMREWLGPRQVRNVASKKLTVTARKFEHTIGVPVDDIRDDQYGLYNPLVAQMGMNAANLATELVFAALVGNANWLDSVAFFSTAGRSYDGTNAIANYGTAALTATLYGTTYAAMMGWLGHEGKPLNVRPNLLVVGPKLMATAKAIVESPYLASTGLTGEATYVYGVTAPNPWYNSAKLLVSTQLVGTYDDYWFLMDTSGVVKPVVYCNREPARLTTKDREEDDNVFMDDQIVYGTKARGEAALAFPHLCYAAYVS